MAYIVKILHLEDNSAVSFHEKEQLQAGITDFACFLAGSEEEDEYVVISSLLKAVKFAKKSVETAESFHHGEEQNHTVIEELNEGLIMVGQDDVILFVDHRACEISGYSADEMIGKIADKLILPMDSQEIVIRIKQSRLQGRKESYETKILNKNGDLIWVRITESPVYNRNGTIVGSIRGLENINEQKLIAQRLEQQQNLLRTIINSIPDLIFFKDTNRVYTGCNTACGKYLGMTEKEMIGKTDDELFTKPEAEFIGNLDEYLLESHRPQIMENWEVCPDGRKVFFETSKTLVYSAAGEVMGIVGISRDITERKMAEDAVKESRELFQTLAQVSPVGIFRTLPDGATTYVNPKWSTLSGLSFDEALGDGWLKAVHPDDREKVKQHWEDDSLANEPSNAGYRFLKPDGTIVWVIGYAVPELRDGQVAGYIGTITDITPLKEIEKDLILAKERAEASDKLKTAFMNNISHEVRTPLNGILGFSSLIQQTDISEEEKKQFHNQINLSSKRLLKTITSYMDISLITSGNMNVTLAPIYLNRIIHQIFDQFCPDCIAKKVVLQIDIPDHSDGIKIITDQDLLLKVISHLVDNAVKFTQQGKITIGYTIQAGMVEIFVKDTGSGIKEDVHATIFEHFAQGETADTRGYEGSGLGLSIANGIVKLLDGKISMESKTGVGSTFKVAFPFELEQGSNRKEAGAETMVPEDVNPVILIVEDDDLNLHFLELILKRKDFTILVASNGREAVGQCRSHQEISLVLMDVKMPVMNGLEATREIKSFRKDLPIIAVTAYAMSGDQKKIMEAGCDDYLAKPITMGDLFAKLCHFLGAAMKL